VLPLLRTGTVTVDVVLGPRDDWFTGAAVRKLLEEPWHVSPASNRIGVRLTGPALERATSLELPSEPCLRGSIQIAADGQPIVFGPDHPVTGGYPVIAVVIDAHTDFLAQARPGQRIRFRRRA
jgi:allophanate hydrolase subunit 2